MSKIGLVVEGGGMKCAYGAGVLDCFLDYGIHFDYCIGVSAGSANAASFLAGQKKRNLRFYTVYVKDKQYLSMHNYLRDGQVFGLQYIYGNMSNSDGIDPLDYETLEANPCDYEIVATDAETGEAVYFNKKDLKKDDYRPIMASSAMPVFCRPVEINGRLYYDGGVIDAIPVQRALEQGCDKVVVILSKTRDFVKEPERHKRIYTRKLKHFPNIVKDLNERHIMYRREMEAWKELEKEGKAFVYAPSEAIRISTFTKDPAIESKFYELGIKDFKSSAKALKEFLTEE